MFQYITNKGQLVIANKNFKKNKNRKIRSSFISDFRANIETDIKKANQMARFSI